MLKLYWKNATSRVVGSEHGITPTDLNEIDAAVRSAHEGVLSRIAAKELGYAKLVPVKANPAQADAVGQVGQYVRDFGDTITDLVVLGIGGSALGSIALQAALNPSTYNLLPREARNGRPRMFVLDNVDPALVGDVLSFLDGTDEKTGKERWQSTVVNVISKSGETAETAAQFLLFRDIMRRKLGEGFAERIVATCGFPEKGKKEPTLYGIVKPPKGKETDGYKLLEQFPDVGGRFSVLSCGLFTAEMCGISTKDLLRGAAAMKKLVEAPLADRSWRKNPACVLAAVKHLAFARKRKPMHVMMPYSNRLYLLADWYRQLWAESLGKRRDRNGEEVLVGPTPIKALGTTDQHSQVQLYREGPNDKLVVFLESAEHEHQDEERLTMPTAPVSKTPKADDREETPEERLAYLGKKKLADLLNNEKTATEYALSVSNRPTVTIRFPKIDAYNVGAFFYLYEFTTSLMGELLDIDAYDQPAVELGKDATFALMGRNGCVRDIVVPDLGGRKLSYEDFGKEIRGFAEADPEYLV